jgi:hypothetical protein
MTDAELIALDKSGFIPGPGEKEAPFRARIEKAKKKYNQGSWLPPAHWNWVHEHLDSLFNVKPLYICAFYSNKRLTPWQGAASWIEGRSLHSIQLRDALKKGSYLGLYSREEILAHEAVHAARSGFEESRYEEFFAYMTSSAKWRRVLGPILQKPWEAWPFLIFLTAGIFFPGAFLGAAVWLGLGFIRLIRGHRTLNLAAERLIKIGGDSRVARSILFRLTDEEIGKVARGEKIEGDASLRWNLINAFSGQRGQFSAGSGIWQ